MSKTRRFLREEETFKLQFGTRNNNWESVKLTQELQDEIDDNPHIITDGIYLSEKDNTGEYEIADEGDFPAYPILEEKAQYDNKAANMFTVSVGSVPAYTKKFVGDPEQGDYLKTTDEGELEETEDKEVAVARCLNNYGEYIKILKLV